MWYNYYSIKFAHYCKRFQSISIFKEVIFVKKTSARILAGLMAAATVASFSACGGGGEGGETSAASETTTTTAKTEWSGDNVDVTVADDSVMDVDIKGKSLKWMGFYDLNPTNDSPERSVELSIFEDTYGAKIEYIPTTTDQQFNDLATAVLGGTSPDIFVYDLRAFPYDISKGMYQPIDSVVDWEDPMWAEMKGAADTFLWNGEHYIAPFGYRFDDYVILMYNKTQVEALGMNDPYELYLEDKWDWDAFMDMMETFQGGDTSLYGISGWWANSFVYTAGDVMVTYDGEKFTNNLYSEKIEKAQHVIEEIWDKQLVKRGWVGPDAAFTSGDCLFYSMGTWAYDGAAGAMPEDEIQIVPYPKNPDSDQYYLSKIIFSHMWVKGSDNADCIKVWFDINRQVNYDEEYLKLKKEKFLENNKNWTSELYDIVYSYSDDEKFAPAYEYGSGISESMTGDSGYIRFLYECIVNEQYETWEQAREEYYNIIDSEIAVYNE